MNAAHVHLAVNHLPVVGILIGTLILAWAVVRQADAAARVALAVLVGAALSAAPAFLSGEPAEEIVEHRADISERLIEAHEEAAEAAVIGAAVLGTLCAGLLLAARRARTLPALPARTALVAALVVTVLMLRTANLGGRIHHVEIRGGEASSRPGIRTATDTAYRMP